MRIEPGGTYRNRRGEDVTVRANPYQVTARHFPVVSDHDPAFVEARGTAARLIYYHEDGTANDGFAPSTMLDLVSEVAP